jgi:hypothetical protein
MILNCFLFEQIFVSRPMEGRLIKTVTGSTAKDI